MERIGGSFEEDAADQKGGCHSKKAKHGVAAVDLFITIPEMAFAEEPAFCLRPPPE
jgi:hypothetical protein